MKLAVLSFALCVSVGLSAQTFEVGGQGQSAGQKSGNKDPRSAQQAQPGQGFGWGSSIEVGRMARAANDAMRRGNYAAAATYAERAVAAAPNNPEFYFLLGYTSRMAGRLGKSLDAYRRGLRLKPGAVEGLSGMAQTYMRSGRTDEAKRLLTQVIEANPRRENDLLMAGELFIQTGEPQRGITYLERAEAIKPSSHAELLLATAYMRSKQMDKARRLLEMAKRRDPKNVNIFRAVANFQREVKDYNGAIATLKSSPSVNADLLGDLGYSYELAGRKKEAAETYARAAKADPARVTFALSAAQSYLGLEDFEKTKVFLQQAEKTDPNYYRLFAVRAALARREKRDQDAIRDYQMAVSRLPEDVPEGRLYPISLRLNLSELLKADGQDAAAKEQLALAEKEIDGIQAQPAAKAEFLRVRAAIRAGSDNLAGAEADLKEAMQLDPKNVQVGLQYANLLWRMKRPDDARKLFQAVLKNEPNNRYALEGMGYLAREAGNNKLAEQYFLAYAKAHPDDYVPHLALGDMYTDLNRYKEADFQYQLGYEMAPSNSLIIASAANASIDAHDLKLTKQWLDRAKGGMNDDPRVSRERQRYLFHTGEYLGSARLGLKNIQQLQKDRDVSVYLAYALYNLGRFDDVLVLSNKYQNVLQKEANFPLLIGHVHKQSGLLNEAVDDYTEALGRDPNMIEAHVNRGYVFNDLQNPEQAIQDFNAALKLNKGDGVALLGRSFSNLQLRKSSQALEDVNAAARIVGESGPTHEVRATAFRQQRLLNKAEDEYRAALGFNPDDVGLHLAIADTQYYQHKYAPAVQSLENALRLDPDNAFIYAKLAHSNAHLGNATETMRYIQLAEQNADEDRGAILLATGDALFTLGDKEAAMDRFALSLEAPDANRVDARLAIAKYFVRDGEWEDAKQQIGMAFAESRVGESSPITADNLIEAANLFLSMQDFDMSEKYFEQARNAGAADQVVAIGLANVYLAKGDTRAAEGQLALLGDPTLYESNYDYMLARASMYRQQQEFRKAIRAFAMANSLAPDQDVAERSLFDLAEVEGRQLNQRFSMTTRTSFGPIFEDSTVYAMDQQLLGATTPDQLPTPRSSYESRVVNDFRIHNNGFPDINATFQLRNARGEISFPSEVNSIIRRNTYDTVFGGSFSPRLRFGKNQIFLNPGIAFTLRRDSQSDVELNQNLFKQYLYLSTTSFFNWIAVRGTAFHEGGGFTLRDLSSRDLGANIEFVVGRPWGKTALLTGYSVRDLLFDPLVREYFSTTAHLGVERKFGENFKLKLLGEYIRSWRIQDLDFVIAQAMVPAASFEYKPSPRWAFEGNFAWMRGQGNHLYDNMQSGFFISYVKPVRRSIDDGTGPMSVDYPVRFSVGLQQQSFFDFPGRGSGTMIRPVFRLTFF